MHYLFNIHYILIVKYLIVNTSLSLILAGLILKLSIYGLIRYLLSTFYLSIQFLISFILSGIMLGVLIITCSLFRYLDSKKIIAFSSIIHLNIIFISLLSFNSCGLLASMIVSLSHSFSSVALFLLSGLLINKTYSRYIDSIFMINYLIRILLILFILCNLNIPGSINFFGEILSLISIIVIDYLLILFFLFISFLSTLFWFIILNRKLSYYHYYSLSIYFLLLLFYIFIIIFILGYYIIIIHYYFYINLR